MRVHDGDYLPPSPDLSLRAFPNCQAGTDKADACRVVVLIEVIHEAKHEGRLVTPKQDKEFHMLIPE